MKATSVCVCALAAFVLGACGGDEVEPQTPDDVELTPASDYERHYEYETPSGEEVEVETEVDVDE